MTKKEQNKFEKWALDLFYQLGAVDDGTHWRLNTIVGPLLMNVGDSTIFTRFENADAARALVDCGFSGKWNHCYYGSTAEDAIRDFKGRMRVFLKAQLKEVKIQLAVVEPFNLQSV